MKRTIQRETQIDRKYEDSGYKETQSKTREERISTVMHQ